MSTCGDLAAGVYAHTVDAEATAKMLEEHYQGAFDSLAAWAGDLLEQIGQLDAVPESLRGYFDHEAFARDAELGGDIIAITTADGRVHFFDGRQTPPALQLGASRC